LLARYSFNDPDNPGENTHRPGAYDGTVTGTEVVDGVSEKNKELLNIEDTGIDRTVYKWDLTASPSSPTVTNGRLVFTGSEGLAVNADPDVFYPDTYSEFQTECKFKWDGTGTTYVSLFTLWSSGAETFFLSIDPSLNRIELFNGGPNALIANSVDNSVVVGQEHHVAFTVKGTVANLFLDGTLVSTGVFVTGKAAVPQLHIGTFGDSPGSFGMDGEIWDISIGTEITYEESSRTELLLNSDSTNGSSDMTGLDVGPFSQAITNTSVIHSTAKTLPGSATSLYFNGSAGLDISRRTAPKFNKTWKLETWAYPTNSGSNQALHEFSDDINNVLSLKNQSGVWNFIVYVGAVTELTLDGGDVRLNAWSKLEVNYSPTGEWVFKVNGIVMDSGSYLLTSDSFNSTSIGYRGSNSTQYFNGYLQYLKVDYGPTLVNGDENVSTDLPSILTDFTPPTTLPAPVQAEYGVGRKFDGASYLTGGGFDLTTATSIAMWFKVDTATPTMSLAQIKHDVGAANPDPQYRLDLVSGNYRVLTRNDASTTTQDSTAGKDYGDGRWHHAVLTVEDSGNLKGYVDGELELSTALLGNLGSSANRRLLIGAHRDDGDTAYSTFLTGSVDDVRVYNRALTEEEIKHLYRPGIKATQPDPVVKYDFSDGLNPTP